MTYTKKYAYILTRGNAPELFSLTDHKRMLVMKAMSTLSKYLGCYDRWKDICTKHQLKWAVSAPVQSFFEELVSGGKYYDGMVSWLQNTYSEVPKSYQNILRYATLTGLRPTEACQSIALVKTDLDNYLKRDSMTIEHFRYPETFIRKTKKAFVSAVNDSIIDLAKDTGNHSYNSIRIIVERNGMEMKMSLCRKIFATFMRKNGIEPEIIDILQGRTPKSVFARHYFRPNLDYSGIRKIVERLDNEIFS